MRSDLGIGLDALAPAEMARVLIAGQRAALEAVDVAREAIGRAAARMAETLGAGGRLAYGGAGSSALMAAADALELGGTFGVSPERILILMAGGLPVDARMPGASEDDEAAGRAAAAVLDARDLMIAVSASGRTPYALGLARAARDRGAAVIAIANVPGAPLLALADVPVCLPTPPEIVAGSTRLGAGTAQKAALNAMSTIMGALTGRIHDGFMVGLVADNAK
ncbi:MAG: N-acetylmuramic acid 6-phosphate etherase, partial [Alphaproteobacteria bacterium]